VGQLLFRPVGIASGLLAGLVASKLFEFVWGRFSAEEAPEPGHREISWPMLIAALLVEGAIFRLTRGVVDRGLRVAFARSTGSWPGEEKPDRT
jgi:hypothetical protein